MQAASPAPQILWRNVFAPPNEGGLWPPFLAISVHIVLLLCLYNVVKWHDQPVILQAQAELWPEVPQASQAEPPPPATEVPAPSPVPNPAPAPEPLVPIPAKPSPSPTPVPKPEPLAPPKPTIDAPKQSEADIANDKKKAKKRTQTKAEKKAALAEVARKLKEERDAASRKEREQKDREEASRKEREQKDKEEAARKEREQKDKEEATRKEREQKDKEEAARKERERERQTKEQEDRIKKMIEKEQQTEELKQRIVKNATIEITALDTTTNLVAKISDKYAASIQAAIRPNITFTDAAVGNPAVEIHVKLAADGTILGSAIFNPSGTKTWDTAALRALDKTERLPRDENGRAPPMLVITLRPRER